MPASIFNYKWRQHISFEIHLHMNMKNVTINYEAKNTFTMLAYYFVGIGKDLMINTHSSLSRLQNLKPSVHKKLWDRGIFCYRGSMERNIWVYCWRYLKHWNAPPEYIWLKWKCASMDQTKRAGDILGIKLLAYQYSAKRQSHLPAY